MDKQKTRLAVKVSLVFTIKKAPVKIASPTYSRLYGATSSNAKNVEA